jgi:hypothetical protein
MDVEKGLELAEQLLNRTLKPLEVLIFQESWKGREGKKYKEIAEIYICPVGTVNDAASDLWKLLSKSLGKKVIKSNFRRELEKRSHSATVPQSQEQAQEETPCKNPNFLGREKDIDRLTKLVSGGAKIIGIYAKGGVGKTTIASQFFKQKDLDYWEIPIAIQTQDITPVEEWIKNWLGLTDEGKPELDFGIMLQRVKEKLQDKKIGVLIDNLESALDDQGRFIKKHRRYVELLRLLADSDIKSVTLITSRERLNESKVTVKAYELRGLDEAAWRDFFSSHNINTASTAFNEMHKAHGGNAKAMEILCGTILEEPYEGDLEAYWQENKVDLLIERDLEDLVSSQFTRLEQTDPHAYKLLCRLGVYPYQKFPQLPSIALMVLLWDVPTERRKRVIKSLQDRFLVESSKDGFNKIQYWLHPVIRAEAISRLKSGLESTDELLLSMKQQIDAMLASDNNLQNFLTQLNQKAILVLKQWNFSQVPDKPKPATVRAVYFTRPPELNLDRNRDLACAIGLDLAYGYFLARTYNVEFALERVLELSLLTDITENNSVGYVFNKTLIDNVIYTAYDCTIELYHELQQLKDKLFSPEEHSKIFDWWQSNGQAWIQQLRAVMIKYFEIGYDWQFSNQQKDLLKQYYQANQLLVDCLDTASEEVRSHIEDTLLLPSLR